MKHTPLSLRALLALITGAVAVFGFSPYDLFFLPPLCLALLFNLWRNASSPRQAATLGWIWGCGFFLTGISWVYVSLHDIGGMPAPFALTATLLFCLFFALYPALAGGLFRRFSSGAPWRDALLVAAIWMFTEWLRGWLLTGFPWLASGYAHTPPSPLAGYAAVTGVYGIGLLSALLSGLLAWGWQDNRLKSRFALLLAFLLIPGLGALLSRMDWTQPTGKPLTVSLLQGNIPQESKWERQLVPMSLAAYRKLVSAYPAQLRILPETALPMFIDEVPEEYLAMLLAQGDTITGVAARVQEPGKPSGYANIALALTQDHPLQSYAKSHLVPFGEYTPAGFLWFMAQLNMPMSDFSPGAKHQPPLEIAGQKIAANICYEDLFGEEIIRALPQATLLVNLSNTAWFGDSLAQPQHLQIARMRALETGRTMLRATNTGMTAAIAPDGRILGVAPPFQTTGLTVEVMGHTGATPYVRWGNTLALLMATLMAFVALRPTRRRDEVGNETKQNEAPDHASTQD